MLSQEERAAKLAALEKRMSGVWNPEEAAGAGPQAGTELNGVAAGPAAAAAPLPAAMPDSSEAATARPAPSGGAAASVPAAGPAAVASSPAMPPAMPAVSPSTEPLPPPPPADDPSLPPPPSLAGASSMLPPPLIAKGTPVFPKPIVVPPLGQKQVPSAAVIGKGAVVAGKAPALSQPSQAKLPIAAAKGSTAAGVKLDPGVAAGKAPAASPLPAVKGVQASAVKADPSGAADSKAPASSNPVRSSSAAPVGKALRAPAVKLDPARVASDKVPAPGKPSAAKPAAIAAKPNATSAVKVLSADTDKKVATAAVNGQTSAGLPRAVKATPGGAVRTSNAAGSQLLHASPAAQSASRAAAPAPNLNSLANGSHGNAPKAAQPVAGLHAKAGGSHAATNPVAGIEPESVSAPPALKPGSSIAQHLESSAAVVDQVIGVRDAQTRKSSEHASSVAVGVPKPPTISQRKYELLSEAPSMARNGVDGGPEELPKTSTSSAANDASRRAGPETDKPAKRATSPALDPKTSSAERSQSKHGPVRQASQNGSETLPGPPSKRPRLDQYPSRRPSSADASGIRAPHNYERAAGVQKRPSSASSAPHRRPDVRPSPFSRLSRGSSDTKGTDSAVQQPSRSRDEHLEDLHLDRHGSAKQANGSASGQPHAAHTKHRQSSKLEGKQHESSHRERHRHDPWRRVSRPDSQERPHEVSCLWLRRSKHHCRRVLYRQPVKLTMSLDIVNTLRAFSHTANLKGMSLLHLSLGNGW